MQYVVGIVTIVLGLGLAWTGRANIQNRTAEETGKRRTVNRVAGRSNTSTGAAAVRMGWIRVVMGAAVAVFGLVFLFTGPMLG